MSALLFFARMGKGRGEYIAKGGKVRMCGQ